VYLAEIRALGIIDEIITGMNLLQDMKKGDVIVVDNA